MTSIQHDPSILLEKSEAVFTRHPQAPELYEPAVLNSRSTSAVLFLLGISPEQATTPNQPSLILNKRSRTVKQPGDLCFPGGSPSMPADIYLAKLLKLPGSPLRRWPSWKCWLKNRRTEAQVLATLFATGLRESFEEMRLNPFNVRFLGPLPPQRLDSFDRYIYPLVCWAEGPKTFKANSEVEEILYLPLSSLLIPENYARFRIYLKSAQKGERIFYKELPCFLHRQGDKTECLWGATYRMVVDYLRLIFKFSPPPPKTLAQVEGLLDRNYLDR